MPTVYLGGLGWKKRWERITKMINTLKYNFKLSLLMLVVACTAVAFSAGYASSAYSPEGTRVAHVTTNIHVTQHEMGDGQETHGKNT